ncbi:hypothetical protein B0J14DRAFT_650012 [Halenospora varia]|nr:hypothetical protein B0J14DRAFT_650012 [Halenospora varia]
MEHHTLTRDRPLVTGDDLSKIVCSAIHMVQCLITDFGLDINKPSAEYDHRPENKTLILAKPLEQCGSLDINLKLIELGADPVLPGLPFNGVDVLVKAMQIYHLEASLFCQKSFPVLRAMGSSNKPVGSPELPWPGEEVEIGNLSSRQRAQSHIELSEKSEPGHKVESPEPQDLCHTNSKVAEKTNEISIESIPIDIQEILLNTEGSPYHYQALTFPDSIRLIELQPSHVPDEPIRCRLIQSSISHGVSYEILSGHWGDGSRRVPIDLWSKAKKQKAEPSTLCS